MERGTHFFVLLYVICNYEDALTPIFRLQLWKEAPILFLFNIFKITNLSLINYLFAPSHLPPPTWPAPQLRRHCHHHTPRPPPSPTHPTTTHHLHPHRVIDITGTTCHQHYVGHGFSLDPFIASSSINFNVRVP